MDLNYWIVVAIAVGLNVFSFQLFTKGIIHSLFSQRHSKPISNDHYTLGDIWTRAEIDELLEFVKKVGAYQTTASDMTSSVEHIGEASPFDENGACPFLLVPNSNHSQCVLPSRIDVAQHFIKFGGRDGLKESYRGLSSRLQAFSGFIFESLDSPVLTSLFKSPQYIQAATASCGGLSVFDPIQLGIIILLPGQTVAMHLDVPWFWGATRFNIPQWLLIAMEASGLFTDFRVGQTQGVAYLHDWVEPEKDSGGFFFYPNGTEGPAKVIPAEFNTGLVLDGSVIVHGVDIYRPESKLADIVPSEKNVLKYIGNEMWELESNDIVKGVYSTTDLRISLVWRARCFKTEEEKKKWAAQTDTLSVDHVLSVLKEDMHRKGVLDGKNIPPLDLALKIINEYINYPIEPSSFIPMNYCVWDKVVPQNLVPLVTYFLSWVCD